MAGMERKIFRFPDGCAATENGRLVEYIDLRDNSQSGDIILAKADRMMPGMDCAFMDIGRKKDGFLPLKENSSSFSGESLRSGEKAAVQIRREENGSKGAYLSRDLTIPGQYVILMPMNRHTGVSSRITDENERNRLLNLGQAISAGRFGLVLRAAAAEAVETEIREEAERLSEVWDSIRVKLREAVKPGEILYACDPAAQMIRDYNAGEPVYADEMPPRIRKEAEEAKNRRIRLKSGGNIVIDRCEALTVIDVNSAGIRPLGDKEATVTETNLEACDEAAIQVRLRDIAGIILIDFIDMEREEDRRAVSERLQHDFSRDRRKTVIHGWTSLGIMEMTRKRV